VNARRRIAPSPIGAIGQPPAARIEVAKSAENRNACLEESFYFSRFTNVGHKLLFPFCAEEPSFKHVTAK
jgi:hypothetical protein